MFDCSKCVPKKCQADCCIYVPLPKKVWKKYKHLVQQETIPLNWDDGIIRFDQEDSKNVLPLTENMRCPFLDKNYKCVIYENRPFICRIFGVSTARGLQCYYMKSDGTKRGKKDREKLCKENEANLNRIVKNINVSGEKLTKLKKGGCYI